MGLRQMRVKQVEAFLEAVQSDRSFDEYIQYLRQKHFPEEHVVDLEEYVASHFVWSLELSVCLGSWSSQINLVSDTHSHKEDPWAVHLLSFQAIDEHIVPDQTKMVFDLTVR